jgi:two-component system LytT family sensor kinase
MIVHDAQVRADGERFRVEAERSRALLAEAQLAALRARLHPHFLFNALTSIAALCRMAPEKAEAAVIQLGQITRRALEADARASIPLADEIEYVEEFVEIEKLRLGERLRVLWDVDRGSAAAVRLPPFVLQTLVENAIQHGIAPKIGPGTVTVTVRGGRRRVVVAVRDDGVGADRGAVSYRCGGRLAGGGSVMGGRGGGRPHGLEIVAEQLCLLYGHRARLRLFGRPDVGTCVVFSVPRRAAGLRGTSVRGGVT